MSNQSQFFKRKMKELGLTQPKKKAETLSIPEAVDVSDFMPDIEDYKDDSVEQPTLELKTGLAIGTRKLALDKYELVVLEYNQNGTEAEVIERIVIEGHGHKFDMEVKKFLYEKGMLGIELDKNYLKELGDK